MTKRGNVLIPMNIKRRFRKKKVYLAGGISGLTKKEASVWRDEVARYLHLFDIEVGDPMKTSHVHDPGDIPYDTDYSVPRCSSKIFQEDLKLINQCDLLFARLDTAKSIGTPWELGYAYAKGIPIILVSNRELLHHPFVQNTTDCLYTNWKQAYTRIPFVIKRTPWHKLLDFLLSKSLSIFSRW